MNTASRLMMSLALAVASGLAQGQASPPPSRMKLLDVFDAGQPNAIILKLYDPGPEVICYVLMPEKAMRKQAEGGWVYEGNSVGSISCVDRQIRVINETGSATIVQPSSGQPTTAQPVVPQGGNPVESHNPELSGKNSLKRGNAENNQKNKGKQR